MKVNFNTFNYNNCTKSNIASNGVVFGSKKSQEVNKNIANSVYKDLRIFAQDVNPNNEVDVKKAAQAFYDVIDEETRALGIEKTASKNKRVIEELDNIAFEKYRSCDLDGRFYRQMRKILHETENIAHKKMEEAGFIKEKPKKIPKVHYDGINVNYRTVSQYQLEAQHGIYSHPRGSSGNMLKFKETTYPNGAFTSEIVEGELIPASKNNSSQGEFHFHNTSDFLETSDGSRDEFFGYRVNDYGERIDDLGHQTDRYGRGYFRYDEYDE